jgi:putative DNA primase/helicase
MGVFGKMGYLQGEKFDMKFKLQITSHAVGTFVNDCLEIDGSLSWRLHTKVLYETYIKWCNENNERVMSQKWMGLSVKVEWRGIVK